MKKFQGMVASNYETKDGRIGVWDIAVLFNSGDIEMVSIPTKTSPELTADMLRVLANKVESHSEEKQ